MYTIKKFKKNEIITQNTGDVLITVAPSTCYAVIDHEGNVLIGSTQDVEVYWHESSAQKVANWYNKQ